MNVNGVNNSFAQILQEIQTNSAENQKCFDCAAANPDWASVNNGIFICYQCARIHSSFGAQISFVKSIKYDTWSQKQVYLMSLGGNESLKDYL